MTIYTIGYEGTSLMTFIKCLHINHINVVLDVRLYPFSRKPGFSQKALQTALNQANISYRHFAELGCPADIRDNYKLDNNWSTYVQLYNAYLDANPEILKPILPYLSSLRCALMCFEADANFCHRSLIAKRVMSLYPDCVMENLMPQRAKQSRQKESAAQSRLAFA